MFEREENNFPSLWSKKYTIIINYDKIAIQIRKKNFDKEKNKKKSKRKKNLTICTIETLVELGKFHFGKN